MGKHDSITDLDFAYRGFQYPLPPSWKRAIRLEDQINWLLQAILWVDDDTVGAEELSGLIAEVRGEIADGDAALAEAIEGLREAWRADDEAIYAALDKLTLGLFLYQNPVTGGYDYPAVVARQLYDASRPFAVTYADLDYLGQAQASIHPGDSERYLAYADLDGLPIGSYQAVGATSGTGDAAYMLLPPPAPSAEGRMATAEYAATDKLTYIALSLYGRFVVIGAIRKAGKSEDMLALLNVYLNGAITPAASIADAGPGYDEGINVFTTYGEIDRNGVLGYVSRNQ